MWKFYVRIVWAHYYLDIVYFWLLYGVIVAPYGERLHTWQQHNFNYMLGMDVHLITIAAHGLQTQKEDTNTEMQIFYFNTLYSSHLYI